MIVAVIVAPTLVILIVQVSTFPLTLHTVMTVTTEVSIYMQSADAGIVLILFIWL